MTRALRIIAVAAFCAATLGAAGLHDVAALVDWELGTPLPHAFWPLVLVVAGVAALIATRVAGARLSRRAAGSGSSHGARRAEFEALLTRLAAVVAALEEDAGGLQRRELVARIGAVESGELFDLVSRHEELATLVGFSQYARVWDGVATAERSIARAWSLATDGHVDAARELVPVASALLEQSRRRLRGDGPG